MRRQAIKAGEHVISHAEKQIHITAFRNYRALRQRKQRDFHRDYIDKLETAMVKGNHNMWQVLKEICDYHSPSRDGPTSEFFFDHFNRLAVPNSVDYFDEGYENMAIDFTNKFQSPVKTLVCCEWESSTLNANFTRDEIEAAIDYLECKKSTGVDNIPVEFIKACE